VIKGTVEAGADSEIIEEGQVAWMDRPESSEKSVISFRAGKTGSRFVFYAAEPQKTEIVSYGPFIGDNEDDIRRLYKEYREGKMGHVHDLPERQIIRHLPR
jgi:quercetin 2,3-dioxygenase